MTSGSSPFETFLNLALGSPHLLNQLGLVVLDEGQFITDPGRGITVELIFSLLLRAQERGIQPQLLVLSAVIGSLNNFDRWLGLPVLSSRERPVPLVEGVLDRRGTLQFVDVDGMTKSETLLPAHQIVQRRQKPSSQDVIVPLARMLVGEGEKLLVFRNTPGSGAGLCRIPVQGARPRSRRCCHRGLTDAGLDERIGAFARVLAGRHRLPQHQSAESRARSGREGLSQSGRRHTCAGGDDDPRRRNQHACLHRDSRGKSVRG